MSNTKDNLQTAFRGESQANHKYSLFAEKAEMATAVLVGLYGGDAKWLK
jgi:rubrerythrin